jgi:MraZ protein
MFLGQYEHTIDEKGRITIPSKYREELDSAVYVTQGFDGNLQVLPPDLFAVMSKQVNALSFADANSRRLRRIIYANAEVINFDNAGRILLPAFLREVANLKETAIVAGNGTYFELWSPENWQGQQDSLKDVEANEQRFGALDLKFLQ